MQAQAHLGGLKGLEALLLPGLHALLLLLLLVSGLPGRLLRLRQKVLSGLQLQVHLAGLLGWREGRVLWLLHNHSLLALHILLPELGQEAVPVFGGQVGVLGQLPLDHEGLDVVDGVHILDAVLHYLPHLPHTCQVSPFTTPSSCHAVRLQHCLSCCNSLLGPIKQSGRVVHVQDRGDLHILVQQRLQPHWLCWCSLCATATSVPTDRENVADGGIANKVWQNR